MSPMAVLMKNGLLALCILIGLTKSSPVEPATAVDQAPESHAPVEYPPGKLGFCCCFDMVMLAIFHYHQLQTVKHSHIP